LIGGWRGRSAGDATAQEPSEAVSLAPKRGGVSVEIVAIAWELT
jgi:hypothetical protein